MKDIYFSCKSVLATMIYKKLFYLLIISILSSCRSSLPLVHSLEWQSEILEEYGRRDTIEQRLTLLVNEQKVLPFANLAHLSLATLIVGGDKNTDFQRVSSMYLEMGHYRLGSQTTDKARLRMLLDSLRGYEQVLIGIYDDSLSKEVINFLFKIQKKSITVVLLDREKTISFFQKKKFYYYQPKSLLLSFGSNKTHEKSAVALLFGAIPAQGFLSENIGRFAQGAGIKTQAGLRLKYALPSEVNIDGHQLYSRLDSFIYLIINKKAIPGCQLLVAREGKVIFHKAYGFHTYESQRAVRLNDLYDLASITKIGASAPALMFLYDNQQISLSDSLPVYWNNFEKTDKKDISLRHALSHFSGFPSYLAHWKKLLNNDGTIQESFLAQAGSSLKFGLKDSICLDGHQVKKMMLDGIEKAKLKKEIQYLYSALFFDLVPDLVEKRQAKAFDVLLKENFYDKIGANSLIFNPLKKYSLQSIVPTEYDSAFRKTLVHGQVHDENAAICGGISGGAGLFGNANDLAKLMQLYLWKGKYGFDTLLKATTVEEFTRCQFCEQGNRRGLVFDKPMKEWKTESYVSSLASADSYGHSGFTGTFAWADPKSGLLVIFLSNRVYPSRNNRKLYELNTFSNIHHIVYESIITD